MKRNKLTLKSYVSLCLIPETKGRVFTRAGVSIEQDREQGHFFITQFYCHVFYGQFIFLYLSVYIYRS